MRQNNSNIYLISFLIIGGIVWFGSNLEQWVWWLCSAFIALIGVGFICAQANERWIARAPCPHGIAGANLNCELCAQCKIQEVVKRRAEEEKRRVDERKRQADEEMRRVEREREYRCYLRDIRLPSYLREMDPFCFEKLACDLHSRMGYEVEATQYSGDNGVDGFLQKDGELAILQAKRVQGSVGEPILRDLFGTMHSKDAKSCVVVTTGKVSRQARKWAANKPIRIIELEELSSLIRQYFPEDELVPSTFAVSAERLDFCPKCHSRLKKKKGRYGKFFGCSSYPACKYTRKIASSVSR